MTTGPPSRSDSGSRAGPSAESTAVRLFLDANVLFTAAHNRQGKAALLVELSALESWALATSGYAVGEARTNLRRKYPSAEGRLDGLLETVRVLPDVDPSLCTRPVPAKDKAIVAAAVAWRATHLLTGDLKHFGQFMTPQAGSAATQSRDGSREGVVPPNGPLLIQTVASFLAPFLAEAAAPLSPP
ncbi:MAG: PIN domain-containing protein [Thermoleophilia bacterium]